MSLAESVAVGRRSRLALACALAVTGGICITVVVTQQQHAPSVALAIATATTASAAPTPATPRGPRPLVLAASIPTTIEIPAIGVRSSLLQLGQAEDGSLAVPPAGAHYDQAGWYRYSPTPGAMGPSVIVGHIDSKRSGPSVFFRLGDLRPHDTVRVARADGSVAVFAVEDVQRYHKAEFPTQLVYGNTDHAALRLVSCGGPFDRATGHYLDNVVVTASLVRPA
jgi:hypothetical protein